jgi:hypothetical protein
MVKVSVSVSTFMMASAAIASLPTSAFDADLCGTALSGVCI